MNKFLKKYIPFTKGTLGSIVEYRVSLIIWFFVEVLYIVVAYFTWKAVYESSTSDTLEGYTFAGMVIYLFMQRIVFNLTFIQPHWYIVDDVKEGSIAMQLIKPISYRFQLLFRGFGDILLNLIFFTIPFLILFIIFGSYIGLDFSISFIQSGFFILSIILATLINFFVSFSFGIIVFFTINGFGIWQFKRGIEMLFSGSLIPLVFFPDWLQNIAYVLPFSQIVYTPIRIIMGQFEVSEMFYAISYQVLWVLIMYIISTLFWKMTTKRLTIMGG